LSINKGTIAMKSKNKLNRLLISLPAALLLATTVAYAGETTRISVSSAGAQGNSESEPRAISADGRFVAFWSNSPNLVAGDTNGSEDAFVRDRMTGKTSRISVSSSGEQGNNGSYPNAFSADGRYVAFESFADNLVAGDTNHARDAFVHDRVTGKTTRISVGSTGKQANNYSYPSAISADGRYVAFGSYADNLVAGDTNGRSDAFVRDRVTGKTTRVSVGSAGEQGNGGSYP
jgi:WD40-like Beta Propeller Repeat